MIYWHLVHQLFRSELLIFKTPSSRLFFQIIRINIDINIKKTLLKLKEVIKWGFLFFNSILILRKFFLSNLKQISKLIGFWKCNFCFFFLEIGICCKQVKFNLILKVSFSIFWRETKSHEKKINIDLFFYIIAFFFLLKYLHTLS